MGNGELALNLRSTGGTTKASDLNATKPCHARELETAIPKGRLPGLLGILLAPRVAMTFAFPLFQRQR